MESTRAQARLRRFWPAAAITAAWIPLLILVSRADFAFHNDYLSVMVGEYHRAVHMERGHLLMIGRPIGAALLQLYHGTFNSMAAVGVAHLLGILLGFLLSLTLYAYLRRALAVDRVLATATAIGLPMLPSAAIGILWMTTQPPGLLCILYVSILYALHATIGARAPWIRALLLPAWLAAFLLYPPSALFVCALILARLMFAVPGADGGRALLRTTAIEIVLVIAAMLVYLVFVKTLYEPLMQSFGIHVPRTSNDENLIRRYGFQLAGLWTLIEGTLSFLAFSLRLWVVNDRVIATLAFGMLAVLGIAGQVRLFGSIRVRLLAIAMIGLLPALAIAPLAISNFDSFIYRAASGAQASLAILAFRGLGELSRFWVMWRRSRIEPSLARHAQISAAPPVVAGLLVMVFLAVWQIKPVIDDKMAELALAKATVEDFARRFGGIEKGTRAEALLDIAEKGRDARPPYYDLGLNARVECCWGFLAVVSINDYFARKAEGKSPAQPPVGPQPAALIFDFRRVPPLP